MPGACCSGSCRCVVGSAMLDSLHLHSPHNPLADGMTMGCRQRGRPWGGPGQPLCHRRGQLRSLPRARQPQHRALMQNLPMDRGCRTPGSPHVLRRRPERRQHSSRRPARIGAPPSGTRLQQQRCSISTSPAGRCRARDGCRHLERPWAKSMSLGPRRAVPTSGAFSTTPSRQQPGRPRPPAEPLSAQGLRRTAAMDLLRDRRPSTSAADTAERHRLRRTRGQRRSSRLARRRSAWCCLHPMPSWAAPASRTTTRTATLLGKWAATMRVRDVPIQRRQPRSSISYISDRPCKPVSQAPRTDTSRRQSAQHPSGRQSSPQGRCSNISSSSHGRHPKSSNSSRRTAAAQHSSSSHAMCSVAFQPANPPVQGLLNQQAQQQPRAVLRSSSASCRPSCGAARAPCRRPRGRATSSAPSRSSLASRRARSRCTRRTGTSTTRCRRPCSGAACLK